jgi:hypothetical protein
MNIALGILVVLVAGFALYTIIKQSRRLQMKRNRPNHYSTGTESGGLYYTSSDIFENDRSDQDSSGGGAESGWGDDSSDAGGGGDGGSGGDGGGGGD